MGNIKTEYRLEPARSSPARIAPVSRTQSESTHEMHIPIIQAHQVETECEYDIFKASVSRFLFNSSIIFFYQSPI